MTQHDDQEIAVEVASADGGTYVLRHLACEATDDGLEYTLILHGSDRRAKRRAAAVAAIVSPLALCLLLAVAIWTAADGQHHQADGLMSASSKAPNLVCCGIAGAPFAALIGYFIGLRLSFAPPTFTASFGGSVVVDGVDVGAALRVDTFAATNTVLLVCQHGEFALELAHPPDAVLLGHALERAIRAQQILS